MTEKRNDTAPYFFFRYSVSVVFPEPISPTMPRMIFLLFVIPFHFVIKKINFDANLPKKFLALFARVVAFGAHDAFDAGVDEHLGACRARRHAAIECRFVHGDADSCRLNEGILLGMGRAQTMLGFMPVFVPNGLHLVSDIVAMRG